MGTIHSHIDDEFEGCDDETIYKLDNGQVWQQIGYHYRYHYSYRPRVGIETKGSRGTMHVEGFGFAIEVQRLE